ncbi:hypothetical protein [Xanthomonas albilineans]|uniref:hypothetical protein n=1 Tax=Xanthomonas albilineans TaxID=29447 RepID=UPI0005F356DA|nr:hypothetical protein [Xanthomonas albilineans]
MNSIPFFSWLYDVKMDVEGIRFAFLGFLTVHLLKFNEIKSVVEVGAGLSFNMGAYNFKNRLFARTFLIEARRGWFARKILITPQNPVEFISWLIENKINVE